MHNTYPLYILLLATLLSGCALEDIEKFNECSQPQGIIISSIKTFDAQATEASKDKLAQNKCPNDYPQCVLWGTDSHACSKCEPGSLFCDGQCVTANSEAACGRDCEHITACTGNLKCIDGECACDNYEFSNGTTCNSPEHCGASQDNPTGTRCRDDQKCIWSTEQNNFVCACTNQTFEANNACVDPNNDATCGATPDNPLGTTCENDQTCTSGECKCNNPKMIKCGKKCIFPQSDPHHCGARGKCDNENNNHPDYIGDICDEASGQECINNHCSCQGELIYCDGKCINPSNDNAHCGMFNTTCEKLVTCPANATCTNGTCKCDTGYAHCGNSNTCVPNGETHCGARGGCTSPIAFAQDYVGIDCTKYNDLTCQKSTGICIPKTDKSVKCDPLLTCTSDGAFTGCANTSQFKDNTCNSCGSNDLCGSSCSELLGTKTNCSACGDSCGSGQTCQRVSDKYQCQCARAQDGRELSKCGNTCVDLQFSQANCGKCGNECADDEACIKGVCQPLECEENQYFCLGACRNQPAKDTLTCDQDRTDLICPNNRANCDGILFNGCEIDTSSDPRNCGKCGMRCGYDTPDCKSSRCCHPDGDISSFSSIFSPPCCNHKYKKTYMIFLNKYKCASTSPGEEWELYE